jgi:hypothetical protein
VVLLYIGEDLGARMGPILQEGLEPGARIVSHRFNFGRLEADQKTDYPGRRRQRV